MIFFCVFYVKNWIEIHVLNWNVFFLYYVNWYWRFWILKFDMWKISKKPFEYSEIILNFAVENIKKFFIHIRILIYFIIIMSVLISKIIPKFSNIFRNIFFFPSKIPTKQFQSKTNKKKPPTSLNYNFNSFTIEIKWIQNLKIKNHP